MRSLDSRLEKIEAGLGVDEPEQVAALDPEEEARRAAFSDAMMALAHTMSPEQWEVVNGDLKKRQAGTLWRMNGLTKNFLERAARYVKGDKRPLQLPPEVASVYLHKPERGLLFDRECLSCGYDVVECDGCLPLVRFRVCPLCGGEYEPIEPGQGKSFTRFYRGWSKANSDKVADVYVRESGAIAW